MRLIILEKADGTRRKVPAGARVILEPGEHPVDIEQDGVVLAGEARRQESEFNDFLKRIEAEAARQGYKGSLGDMAKAVFKPFALFLGKTDCVICELRKVILNVRQKIGDEKAIELTLRTFREPPERVAEDLAKLMEG